MQVEKKEILHIAHLAAIELKEEEIDTYREQLQDILDFADIVNRAPIDGVDITIGENEEKNIFREDMIQEFKDKEALLENAPSKKNDMFHIPNVMN